MHTRRLLAAAAILATTLAQADSAHFLRSSGTLTSDGDYVASWKEAGLGSSGQLVQYTLTATSADFQYQCFTKSNNTPHGAPNGTHQSNDSTTGSFPPDHNGQITGSLTISPEPQTDCQGGGLKLCLISVSYTGMTLTDDTNHITLRLPDRSAGSDEFIAPNGRPLVCEPF